jgi:hypothetical protein
VGYPQQLLRKIKTKGDHEVPLEGIGIPDLLRSQVKPGGDLSAIQISFSFAKKFLGFCSQREGFKCPGGQFFAYNVKVNAIGTESVFVFLKNPEVLKSILSFVFPERVLCSQNQG